jgi:predicted nuclease of predicted toxin-antitoxin system
MDLIADENVPRPLIERLRADGHAVVAISETAAGIPDTSVIAASNARGYVLITHDRDFGDLAIGQGLHITGVILLETERLSPKVQVERVAGCLADPCAVWTGQFTVIEPARIRQRAL